MDPQALSAGRIGYRCHASISQNAINDQQASRCNLIRPAQVGGPRMRRSAALGTQYAGTIGAAIRFHRSLYDAILRVAAKEATDARAPSRNSTSGHVGGVMG